VSLQSCAAGGAGRTRTLISGDSVTSLSQLDDGTSNNRLDAINKMRFTTRARYAPRSGQPATWYRANHVAKLVEEGNNYRVELDGRVALCRVWARPDLDSETGARLAAKKVELCRRLAAGEARALLFDLREAPKVTGPKTQKALELLIGVWESAARPIAIIVSPASLQKLQLSRIAKEAAPTQSEVFLDFDQARAWVDQRLALGSRAPLGRPSNNPAAKDRSASGSPGKRRS
jgi:hypothetical protein